MGRNWLRDIRLDWSSIHAVYSPSAAPTQLIYKFGKLFAEEFGTITGYHATLELRTDARPKKKFHGAWLIPFAIKPATDDELDKLEASGFIEKVSHSSWAAPIVTVPKKNGKFCICGDYKVTVNQVLDVDQYPLPTPEQLFTTLAGGKKFTTLDLSQAYQQLPLDDQSKEYVTVTTHCGLYRYTRLPFGIASARTIFQQLMDTVLQGTDDDDHLRNLQTVFQRLQDHGFRLKREKCSFM